MRNISLFILLLTTLCMGVFAEETLTGSDEIHRIEKENTAIVLIEFQKTWTEKGPFYNLIKKQYESRDVLSRTLFLLEKARENNITIIHAPVIIDKENREQYRKMVFFPKFMGRFTKGTWKAEFTEGVFKSGDPVVTGRTAFDATVDSNLEKLLIQGGYTNLLFCGFTTDHCVKETMDALLKKKYNCYIVSDCTASGSAFAQKKMEEKYITVSSQDIIQRIEEQG